MKNLWRNFHVICLCCHWNGQARDLKDGDPVSEGKHSSYSMRCPKCNENLAICSLVDFRAIAGKAIVRGTE